MIVAAVIFEILNVISAFSWERWYKFCSLDICLSICLSVYLSHRSAFTFIICFKSTGHNKNFCEKQDYEIHSIWSCDIPTKKT